jgi:hypothetical protein
MENDIEICSSILAKKIYNKGIIFELELDKIGDKNLRLGLLFELYSNQSWGANENLIIKTINLLYDDVTSKTYIELTEIHEYFKKSMKDWADRNLPKKEDLDECVSFLNLISDILSKEVKDDINIDDYEEIKLKYLSMSDGSKIELNKILLKLENYEELSIISKWEKN